MAGLALREDREDPHRAATCVADQDVAIALGVEERCEMVLHDAVMASTSRCVRASAPAFR
jgi:hypothetical protein